MVVRGISLEADGEDVIGVGGYTVLEDSTPLDPSDLTGGFGQLNVTIGNPKDARRLIGKTLTLNDGNMGETTGLARAVDGEGLRASVRGDSRLGQMAVERTIQPMATTLGAALLYYFSLCGITSGIDIQDGLESVPVKIPGNRTNVYDMLKRLTAAYAFEVSLVSNNIVVRKPRHTQAINYRDASVRWSMDQSKYAQAVSGYYYNTYYGRRLAYPLSTNLEDVSPMQVAANETEIFELPLNASLESIEQPVCVASVGAHDFSQSVYVVTSGVTDNPIDPATWKARGGYVKVSIMEDTRTLRVELHGANIPNRGPFRLTVRGRDGEDYLSLRVRGDGIHWKKELLTIYLNEDVDKAPDEMGAEVDIDFMETKDQLYKRLLLTARQYSTDTQTISVTSGGINRVDLNGSARYPTIGQVKAAYPNRTIGQIKTELGPKIEDWNGTLFAMVEEDFANQAFGNVAGARVLYDNCWYRIRSATLTPISVEYDAERDNTIGDVYRTGETIGQWKARWAGKTIRDVNIAPLPDPS
jgi:hypothetical protein